MGPLPSSAPCPVGPPAATATCYPYLFAGGAGYHPPPVMRSYGAASTLPAYGWSRASVASHPMGPPPSSAPCPMGPPVAAATRYPYLFAKGAGYHSPPVMRSYRAASTLPAYGWSRASVATRPMGPPPSSAPCLVGPPVAAATRYPYLSFSMDKMTGKRCFMLSATELRVYCIELPESWTWPSFYGSRGCRYDFQHAEISIKLGGFTSNHCSEVRDSARCWLWDVWHDWVPQRRSDGWMEIVIGDFFTDEAVEGEVLMSLIMAAGGYMGDTVWS